MKYVYSVILLCISVCCFYACKTETMVVNTEKEFVQVNHQSEGPYDAPWMLNLKPGGVADILPGGDMRYRGTYKIDGESLEVKAEGLADPVRFHIVSATEIREKQYGTVLRLKE